MKITLAVIGAGSLLGRNLCRRAVRIGWDVHAFSIYDLNQIEKESKSFRDRMFYDRNIANRTWFDHVTWNNDLYYDNNFNNLKNEIRNVTGLVYFYEETPLIKSGDRSFEQNCIDLAKYSGNWSVRHFIAVESNNCLLNKNTEKEIGDNTNPFMIISLLRPGSVYDYDYLSSCIKVYKARTLRSIGIDTKPINIINTSTVSKCITTLIHNTNDPNIYRILEAYDIEQYLNEQQIPFDSPDWDYQYKEEEEDDDDDDDDKHKIKITIGSNKEKQKQKQKQENDNDNDNEIESCRDEQEKATNKIL